MAGQGGEDPSGSGGTPVRDAWSRWADRAWAAARRVHLGTRKPGNWVQLFKFGVVGGSGYAINLVAFALLNGSADLGHISAAIGAFLVAVTNNFAWNRIWTFRAEAPGLHPAHQGMRFLLVSLGGLLINLVVLELLISSAGLAELPSQAIAVAVAMPANFIGNKLWTFS
jgi:dolichol-phosphate mannosyltransferase